ncbi:MAG TPA: MFS transporter [Actinomycetota bacterium]|nr:MFS transporter [Actinomycetota bacterium]
MTPLRRAGATTKNTFRSLRVRNYRLYFFGQMVSVTGTWMQTVAQAWLVLKLTHSGFALGLTTGLQFAPVLLAGAWGGVIADRFNKRKVVIATQLAAGLLALILWALMVTGAVQLWMVYVLAFALGCVTVVDVPTRQAFVMEMVGPEDLANAVGLNSTVVTCGRIIGPAIAAGLISTVGIASCFLINGVSYLAVIWSLRHMDVGALMDLEPVQRVKGQVREGLRYVWSDVTLRSSLLLMTVVGTMAFNFRVMLPLLATGPFHGGAGLYGMLSAVMGVGTLIGALISASRARPTHALLIGSALAFGLLIVAAGAAPNLATEIAVLLPMGALSIIFIATCNSTLQLRSTDAMRGRVMALYSVVFLGTTPIGSPLVGWIAQAAGPRASFYVAGGATVLGAFGALWALRRRTIQGRISALADVEEDEEAA